MNTNLTEEQKERIRKNREAALKKQAEKRRQEEQEKIFKGPSPDKVMKIAEPFRSNESVNQATLDKLIAPRQPTMTYMNMPKKSTTSFPNSDGFSRSPLKQLEEPPKPNVSFNFQLVSSERFKITFTPFHMTIVDSLKQIQSRHYDPIAKVWDFNLSDYDAALQKIRTLPTIRVKEICEIPDKVRKTFKGVVASPSISKSPDEILSVKIDDSLLKQLFPYQKAGIAYGVERCGCVLIADEMGLGKSVQALGIARFYRNEWPLLIVCPSSVKYSWRAQIQKFLPSIEIGDIHIIEGGKDFIPKNRSVSTIVIMSYDLMNAKRNFLKDQKFYDESHMIKDSKAQRTKSALELSRIATRRILVSGTPALSRPSELYNQIKIIDPKLFPNFKEFGVRYCDGKEGFYGFETKGATNTDELTAILQNRIMIRRLKKDVKGDLPPKLREIIWMSGKAIESKMEEMRKAKMLCEQRLRMGVEPKQTLMEYYTNTGFIKAPAVIEWVMEQYFAGPVEECHKKVLIFAHHLVVLDQLANELNNRHIKYIRIDGGTKGTDRDRFCDRFQNEPEYLVALLGITAAGVGINLTAASVVVFAELTWNPGTLVQAEDRAHRVGQQDTVVVHYLLAHNTADDEIWPLIENKVALLNAVQIGGASINQVDKQSTMKPMAFAKDGLLSQPITNFFSTIQKENEDLSSWV